MNVPIPVAASGTLADKLRIDRLAELAKGARKVENVILNAVGVK
jgi:hypothetical protein